MSCETINPTDICPTIDEVRDELIALLPPGRAWGPTDATASLTTLWEFWRAVARAIQALEARLCALRNEMWCQTLVETQPEWLAEYGLPDACDPYPNLCAKVAALGGANCAYYVQIAAALGWVVRCSSSGTTITLNVNLSASPSYVGGAVDSGRIAGCYQPSQRVICGPDLTPLDCVMQRILPAHATIVYAY